MLKTWLIAALSAIFGGGIVFRFRAAPHRANIGRSDLDKLETELKAYFGGRFDGIALEIVKLEKRIDKQEERHEKLCDEFNEWRVKVASKLGINGH